MSHPPPQLTLSEASIRKLAHEIWEAEGQPDDRQLRHWHRAEEMLRDSQAERRDKLTEDSDL